MEGDKELLLTQEDDGETVELEVGETLKIQLPEVPSTGYRWEVDALDSALVLQKSEFELDELVEGDGGTRSLVFVAAASGASYIRLKLCRGEEDGEVQQQYALDLEISEDLDDLTELDMEQELEPDLEHDAAKDFESDY